MEFGKVPFEQLDHIDFSLPPHDGPSTAQALAAAHAGGTPRIHLGAPVWQDRHWLGKIYPATMKDREALGHYTRQFNTIELNITHYQIPTAAMLERWLEAATPGFTFCPKFPQAISHDKMLRQAGGLTAEFITQIQQLGPHLGMPFLQLAPGFTPKHGKDLVAYLDALPPDLKIGVEFRHPDWFSSPRLWQRACEVLAERGHSPLITDVAGRRDVLHMSLTTPVLMLRFVGNELHPTDYTRTDAWIARIADWLKMGLQEVWLFIHGGSNHTAPELVAYWASRLTERTGIAVKPPEFLPQVEQMSLF